MVGSFRWHHLAGRCAAAIGACITANVARCAAEVTTNLPVSADLLAYYYQHLVPGVRDRCAIVGLDVPPAVGRYDQKGTTWYGPPDDRRIAAGADGWTTASGTAGLPAGDAVRYRDANGNGDRGADELVWEDADGDGCYTAGTDPVLFGTADDASDGVWGKTGGGFFFADTNGNGVRDSDEDIWQEAITFASEVACLEQAVKLLAPRFLMSSYLGGDWDGMSVWCAAPPWESLDAILGGPFPANSDFGEQCAAMAQALREMVWILREVEVVDTSYRIAAAGMGEFYESPDVSEYYAAAQPTPSWALGKQPPWYKDDADVDDAIGLWAASTV